MIYFDHNASTPVHPAAIEAFTKASIDYYANPLSLHALGAKSFAFLEQMRELLAHTLGASHDEVVFTSGGTEANNLALFGVCVKRPGDIIVSSIEHPAVVACAEHLAKQGRRVHTLPVDSQGIISLDALDALLCENSALVSIMSANNEIGTLQPITEIGARCARFGVPFHTDAVQAFGKIPLSCKNQNISLLSLSSHKMYGPKGCGALIVRKGTPLAAHILGGMQEQSRRGGTHNVPAIAGMLAAGAFCEGVRESEHIRQKALTERLFSKISATIPNSIRNGHPTLRLGGTLNVSFPGTTTEMLLASLDQENICVSGGAACHSGALEPSAVITALGRKKTETISAIRFSLGISSTEHEVETVANVLCTVVARLREHNR